MKNLSQQPIYNFFVSRIDEIKKDIEQGSIQGAFLALMQKVALLDYNPFIDYQEIVEQLKLREQLPALIDKFMLLMNDSTEEITKQSVIEHLEELSACAHFLNFLECSYISPQCAKKQNKALLINTASQLGIVFKEIRRQNDCNETPHFSIIPPQKELSTQPSEQELLNYNKIISVYINFITMQTPEQIPERAKQFARLLFSHPDEIGKDSEQMAQLKANQESLFMLGDIEAVVTLRNHYQRELQTQLNSSEESGFELREIFRP